MKKRKKIIKHKFKKTKVKHVKKRKSKVISKIPEAKPETSRKFLHDLKKKFPPKSEKKEFEFMIKSIEINNPGIGGELLESFKSVDRKQFIKNHPYEDNALHVAHGQTISQPTTIARMLALLNLSYGLDVLEIGTNTGYQAALVAWLVYPETVTSVEIFPDLAKQAEKNIKNLNKELKKIKRQVRVRVFAGDALDHEHEIWQDRYDRIYYTAGVQEEQRETVKMSAVRSLKNEGLLLFPTREHFDYGGLELWQKKGDSLILLKKDQGYSFVPLIKQQDIENVYKKIKKK